MPPPYSTTNTGETFGSKTVGDWILNSRRWRRIFWFLERKEKNNCLRPDCASIGIRRRHIGRYLHSQTREYETNPWNSRWMAIIGRCVTYIFFFFSFNNNDNTVCSMYLYVFDTFQLELNARKCIRVNQNTKIITKKHFYTGINKYCKLHRFFVLFILTVNDFSTVNVAPTITNSEMVSGSKFPLIKAFEEDMKKHRKTGNKSFCGFYYVCFNVIQLKTIMEILFSD